MVFLQRLEGLWRGGVGAFAEIFLLFIVIYVLLRFLRGSRGAAVLRGMLLLIALSIGIVFLAASLLQLERITWVFEKLSALFMVSLIIIFHPELRRGLLRLGLNPWFRRLVRAGSPTIDEIVEAAAIMSENQVGMLIAIERNVPLTSYIETATPLSAEISSELLRTIFHKDTPLHDGAVVIQGSRVAAAGCVLHLSENPELAKSLGTRHRAALGVTEETDAVVVVVSEETGAISICVDGTLTRDLNREELKRKLTELCLEAVEGGA